MTLYKFTARDDSAVVHITIFNNKYDAQKIRVGEEYLFYGKIDAD